MKTTLSALTRRQGKFPRADVAFPLTVSSAGLAPVQTGFITQLMYTKMVVKKGTGLMTLRACLESSVCIRQETLHWMSMMQKKEYVVP